MTSFDTTISAPMEDIMDVLVIGGGNAALCAGITAREAGATVIMLESSPQVFRGGNSRHTRNIRYLHQTGNEFLTGPYMGDEFWQDLLMVTKGNTREELARFAIRESESIGPWMRDHGAMFQPAMRGTLHLSRTNAFFLGGGKALMNTYYAVAEKLGVIIRYNAEAHDIDIQDGRFVQATVIQDGIRYAIRARARPGIRGLSGQPGVAAGIVGASGRQFHCPGNAV